MKPPSPRGMGKDKNFVRIKSMDVTTLVNEELAKQGESSRSSKESKEGVQHGTPQLSQWPAEEAKPAPLTEEPAVQWAMSLYDTALIVIPILLMVKAVLCVVASRKDKNATGTLIDQVSSMTLQLIQFNNQLVTLFTIVFVMIMAGLVQRIALWKAQKGATVGELEQFHNSTSIAGTLKSIWSLRAFSLTSVVLVLAWAWYYLGSQATTREYSYQNSGVYSDFRIAVLSSVGASSFQDNSGLGPLTQVHLDNLNAEFTQAVQVVEDKAYDKSGAALVPLFGQTMSFPPYTHETDKEGWQDTSIYSKSVYSAYTGALPWGPPADMGAGAVNTMSYHVIGTYSLNSTYMIANCSAPTIEATSNFPKGLGDTFTLSINMTNLNGHAPTAHTPPRTFDLWNRYDTNTSFHSLCALTTTHVEMQISCSPNGCTAVKVRETPGNPSSQMNRTPFDSDSFAYNFFNNLTLSSGVPSSTDDTTIVAQYAGFDNFRQNFESVREFLNNGDKPAGYASDLTRGMTKLINTYFTVSQPHLPPSPLVVEGTEANPRYQVIKMNGAPYLPQYFLSVPWLAVDFASNLVLLIAASLSFYLRKKTIAPDIFGYVSSLTRDNPHIALPEGGSGLSGMARARSLKHVKVKIGDVKGDDGQVGQVALTYANAVDKESGVEMEKLSRALSKKKQYV